MEWLHDGRELSRIFVSVAMEQMFIFDVYIFHLLANLPYRQEKEHYCCENYLVESDCLS